MLLKQIALVEDTTEYNDDFIPKTDMYGEVAESFAPLLTFQNLSIDAFEEIDKFLKTHISKLLRESIIGNLYTLNVLTVVTQESFAGTCNIGRTEEEIDAFLDTLYEKAKNVGKEIIDQTYDSMLDRDLYIDKEIYLMIEYTEHLKNILTKQIALLKVLETFFPAETTLEKTIEERESTTTNVSNTFDTHFNQSEEFRRFSSKLNASTTTILEDLFYLESRVKRQLKKTQESTQALKVQAQVKAALFNSESNFFENMGQKSFEIKTQVSNFKRLTEGLVDHYISTPYTLSMSKFNEMMDSLKSDIDEFDIETFFSSNEEEQEEQSDIRDDIKFQISDRMILVQELEHYLLINSHDSYIHKATFNAAIETFITLKEQFDSIEHEINSRELREILKNKKSTVQELFLKRRQLIDDIERAKSTVDPNSKLNLQDNNIDNLQEMVSEIDKKIDEYRFEREQEIKLDSDLLSLKETINCYFLLETADTALHTIPQFYEKFSTHIQLLIQGKVATSTVEDQKEYWDVLLKSMHLLMQQKPSFVQWYHENPPQLICLSLATYNLSVDNALESPLFNKALKQYEHYIEQFSEDKIQKRHSISVPIASSFQKINTRFELRNFILFSKEFMNNHCHPDLKFESPFENALLAYTIYSALQESKIDYASIKKTPNFIGLTYTSFGKKKELQEPITLERIYEEKEVKDHSTTHFSAALHECFGLIVNRTPTHNNTHQTVVSFLKKQHVNLALRENQESATKLLSLPTTTRKSINGFYLLYFLTATASTGTGNSLTYSPGTDLKIDDLRAKKFDDSTFLLSKMLKVVNERFTDINNTLDKQSVDFREKKYTLASFPFEYQSPFTEDFTSIRDCTIQVYRDEILATRTKLIHTLRLEIERETGSLSEFGFETFIEIGKQGKLSEECLHKFSDSGYTLLSNYIYPLQLLDHTLSILDKNPLENELQTLSIQLRFLKQPATPETLSSLVKAEYFNQINQTKTSHLCKILHVMNTLLGGSPIQDSQVKTMLLPMYRCSQGTNHFEFIIQKMGTGKTTMAKLISHFTDVISIHVAPFREEEWEVFSIESLKRVKPGQHYGMNPAELHDLINTLNTNSDLKEHYSTLNIMYYIDEYSSGKFLTQDNLFIYALGTEYIKKAVYMSGTPNIASLKLSYENTQHLLRFMDQNPQKEFQEDYAALAIERDQLDSDITRVEDLIETTLNSVRDRVEFTDDAITKLHPLLDPTSGLSQNIAIIRPDISTEEEQLFIKALSETHASVSYTYRDSKGVTTLSKEGKTQPLSYEYDDNETYVSCYSEDAIGGDRYRISGLFITMMIQTRDSKFETLSNLIQYFHRLRGNLETCRYYISLSDSSKITNFDIFKSHITELESQISTKLSRINIDSNIASISEELIKFYIKHAIAIENKGDADVEKSDKPATSSLLWFNSIKSKIETNIQRKLISTHYLSGEILTRKIKTAIKVEIENEINSKIGQIKIHCFEQAEQIMSEINDTSDFQLPESDLETLYDKLSSRIFFPLYYALLGTKLSDTNVEIKSTSSRVGILSIMLKSTIQTGSVAQKRIRGMNKYVLQDILDAFLKNLIQTPENIIGQGNETFKINGKNNTFRTYYRDLFSGIEEVRALLIESKKSITPFLQKNKHKIMSLVENIITEIKNSEHSSKSLRELCTYCEQLLPELHQNIAHLNSSTVATELQEIIQKVTKASTGKNSEETFKGINKEALLTSLSKIDQLIKHLLSSISKPINTYYQSILQETLNRLVSDHLYDPILLRYTFSSSVTSSTPNFAVPLKEGFYFTFDSAEDSTRAFLIKILHQLEEQLTYSESLPRKQFILTNYEFWIDQLKTNDSSVSIVETIEEP